MCNSKETQAIEYKGSDFVKERDLSLDARKEFVASVLGIDFSKTKVYDLIDYRDAFLFTKRRFGYHLSILKTATNPKDCKLGWNPLWPGVVDDCLCRVYGGNFIVSTLTDFKCSVEQATLKYGNFKSSQKDLDDLQFYGLLI